MINKNDFIELEYTGTTKESGIFDTNIKEEAKKIQLEIETRPLIICIGQNMILPAIDEFLIGKDTGKYSIELSPEQAFGKRDQSFIKVVPLRVFIEKNIMPRAGMVFNFDNVTGKVSAVSGGRVIVDFNNPLSGKTVYYELNVKRKVEDEKEKVNSLFLFFLRNKFDFEIKEGKILVTADEKFQPVFDVFKDKFKEILNLNLEIAEKKEEQAAAEKVEEKPKE